MLELIGCLLFVFIYTFVNSGILQNAGKFMILESFIFSYLLGIVYFAMVVVFYI